MNILFVAGKKGEEIVEALKEMTRNPDRTALAKRQIDFLAEDLVFKRHKHRREEAALIAAMNRSMIQEKKDKVDIFLSLQKSISELHDSIEKLAAEPPIHCTHASL